MHLSSAITTLTLLSTALAGALPRTFELHAIRDNLRIGCLNGYGQFISNDLACYIFRAHNLPANPTAMSAYETCTITSVGTLDCYSTGNDPWSFWVRCFFITLVCEEGRFWPYFGYNLLTDRWGCNRWRITGTLAQIATRRISRLPRCRTRPTGQETRSR
jgi:hypothetical protein